MNPEQIDIVAVTWREACRDHARLERALRDRLPAPDPIRGDDATAEPAIRAAWIVEAVSRLSPVIDRPTRFATAAGDLMARRGAVTMSELGDDQSALLGTLAELLGDLSDDQQRAWALALKLFEETIAATCLDPFGAPPGGQNGFGP